MILGRGLGGENGVSVSGLLKEGYEAVFLGFGLPDPKSIPIFKDLTEGNGFYTSKDFLPRVASASKPGQPSHCCRKVMMTNYNVCTCNFDQKVY